MTELPGPPFPTGLVYYQAADPPIDFPSLQHPRIRLLMHSGGGSEESDLQLITIQACKSRKIQFLSGEAHIVH